MRTRGVYYKKAKKAFFCSISRTRYVQLVKGNDNQTNRKKALEMANALYPKYYVNPGLKNYNKVWDIAMMFIDRGAPKRKDRTRLKSIITSFARKCGEMDLREVLPMHVD